MAVAKVQQNFIGGVTPNTITVNYGAGGGTNSCSGLVGTSFAVNPIVKVTVQRTGLPIFFGHVFSLVGSNYSSTSVSATASAEAFNPSGSATYAGATVPVQPRCVKPWIVPNSDPGNGKNPFVNTSDGSIVSPGVLQLGQGVIGETFNLVARCGVGSSCVLAPNPPIAATAGGKNYLEYAPAQAPAASSALPSCANGDSYQEAVAGCDQSTAYQCGVASATSPNQVDLTENPARPSGDTAVAHRVSHPPSFSGIG